MRWAWSASSAIGRGDAGEHVLVALAGQQVAVVQRGAAEIGQQRVARAVDLDLAHQLQRRSLTRSGARRGWIADDYLLGFTSRHHSNTPHPKPPLNETPAEPLAAPWHQHIVDHWS